MDIFGSWSFTHECPWPGGFEMCPPYAYIEAEIRIDAHDDLSTANWHCCPHTKYSSLHPHLMRWDIAEWRMANNWIIRNTTQFNLISEERGCLSWCGNQEPAPERSLFYGWPFGRRHDAWSHKWTRLRLTKVRPKCASPHHTNQT